MKTKEEVKAEINDYLDYYSHCGFINNIRYRFNRERKEIFRLYELVELESDEKKANELINHIYMCMALTWKDYKLYRSLN